MDTVSRKTRSLVMAKVKSKRNRSTEWRLRALLIQSGLRGWRVHPDKLPGSPDFVFTAERLAIFTDGCFWHGCSRCGKVPSSNVEYWRTKIERNRNRDRVVTAQLRGHGWRVLRLWEHELTAFNSVVRRIKKRLEGR